MPFGMGPAGWFMMPYLFPYWPGWLPYWSMHEGLYYPGYGMGYYPLGFPPMSKEQEMKMLEEESKALEEELREIRKMIEELSEKQQSVGKE